MESRSVAYDKVIAVASDGSRSRKMARSSTRWIILLIALVEFSVAFPSNLQEGSRFKRQSPAYLPGTCSTCGGLGYGNGLGSYFYGHYGGGYNNNYGGTNIGSINVENING
uniref:Uncharacterized protein n=1 Tax=Ascaris lumbricoides TaxID=6252 RepID=A0A0M3I4L9_ASCLU